MHLSHRAHQAESGRSPTTSTSSPPRALPLDARISPMDDAAAPGRQTGRNQGDGDGHDGHDGHDGDDGEPDD